MNHHKREESGRLAKSPWLMVALAIDSIDQIDGRGIYDGDRNRNIHAERVVV